MPYATQEKRVDYQKQYMPKYFSSEAGKFARRKTLARQKAMYPERFKARNALTWAVYTGKIVKPLICSRCGQSGKIEGHHPDYSKPLEVEWVCSDCHRVIR